MHHLRSTALLFVGSLTAAASAAPALAPFPPIQFVAGAAAGEAPFGRALEARSAALLAGACHYGGELVTAGRSAVLALSFEGGEHRGRSLAGLELALVVEAPESLATDAPRRMLVYLAPEEDEGRARAALAWLASEGLVGELVGLERAVLELATELEGGESYRLRVGGSTPEAPPRIALEGSRLVDRRCCAMPLSVWYDPLLPFAARVVGASERFELREPALGLAFRRGGENDVFVGRFGRAPAREEG